MTRHWSRIGATVAGTAIAAALLGGVAASPAMAGTSQCASGDFCAWINSGYSGGFWHNQAACQEWDEAYYSGTAFCDWHGIYKADSSWYNNFNTLYWVCVYSNMDYVSPTVWISEYAGVSYKASANDKGESDRGRTQSETC